MTTNMKNETLMNLPVLAAFGDAKPAGKPATAVSARKFQFSWLVPCVAVLAAIIAYQTLNNLTELNTYLAGLEAFMQSPQFSVR